jgi:uncharacterized membrane protein YeaQ/YmgE (transglycosylase-associated protein family)
VANAIWNKGSDSPAFDILLGVAGAVLGGWLYNASRASVTTGLNVWSLLVAIVGEAVLLVIWHLIRRTTQHA